MTTQDSWAGPVYVIITTTLEWRKAIPQTLWFSTKEAADGVFTRYPLGGFLYGEGGYDLVVYLRAPDDPDSGVLKETEEFLELHREMMAEV